MSTLKDHTLIPCIVGVNKKEYLYHILTTIFRLPSTTQTFIILHIFKTGYCDMAVRVVKSRIMRRGGGCGAYGGGERCAQGVCG
jgi:hypothetical protein